jgi:hypothetical protein
MPEYSIPPISCYPAQYIIHKPTEIGKGHVSGGHAPFALSPSKDLLAFPLPQASAWPFHRESATSGPGDGFAQARTCRMTGHG